MSFDTFTDTDRLPAPTSHAVLAAEVATLRAQNQRLHEAVTTFREIAAKNLRECSKLSAEAAEVTMESEVARQALRNLVDATSWFQEEMRKCGHIAVNEDAMNVAMALVVEWFGEKGRE